jgi:hypothetical protein
LCRYDEEAMRYLAEKEAKRLAAAAELARDKDDARRKDAEEAAFAAAEAERKALEAAAAAVGQRTLTPPDPQLPIAKRRLVPRWFQPLHPSSEKIGFQNLPFTFNLHCYTAKRAGRYRAAFTSSLPPEPDADVEGAVPCRFTLPDGKTHLRRFAPTVRISFFCFFVSFGFLASDGKRSQCTVTCTTILCTVRVDSSYPQTPSTWSLQSSDEKRLACVSTH